MKLGMQVGLGPGHIVLNGDPAPPPQKGGGSPQFSAHVYCDQMAGSIKIVTWHGGGPRPTPHCARWGRSPPPQKGAQPPNFWPMSLVAKLLDGYRCHLVRR